MASNIVEHCLNARRVRLQQCLAKSQVEVLLVSDHHMCYWLGHPHAPLLFVTGKDLIELEPVQVGEHLHDTKHATVGIDGSLTASQLLFLQESLPSATWVPFEEELRRLLSVKDTVEVALLRQATRITRHLFEQLAHYLKEGQRELDLLHFATAILLEEGGYPFSFDPSIAAGGRTILPWGGVTTYQLHNGDAVVIDLGATCRGYKSDMTRSYLVGGRGADEDKEWFLAMSAVKEALTRVLARTRPGAQCSALHAVCEQALKERGFAMPHPLGHGIGLRVHEAPFLAPGNRDPLETGMVVALEPAVVLASGRGVRYEEVILVTEDGYELLAS
jgi:Xaa-Pro aminopeptidase